MLRFTLVSVLLIAGCAAPVNTDKKESLGTEELKLRVRKIMDKLKKDVGYPAVGARPNVAKQPDPWEMKREALIRKAAAKIKELGPEATPVLRKFEYELYGKGGTVGARPAVGRMYFVDIKEDVLKEIERKRQIDD